MRYGMLCLTFVVLAAASRGFAGENTVQVAPPTPEETARMNEALDSLRGVSGLHGGDSQDMNQFLNMVQTPGMVEVVNRLNAQLAGGEANLDDIDKFVRENLTAEDVEKLLGYKITDEDLQKALSAPAKPDDMQNMLQQLMQSPAGTQ